MTLEPLRATASGVVGVTLKGQGGGFFMEIATRSGQDAILSKAHSSEPRRFGSPRSALILLRDMGIAVVQIDATNWNLDQQEITQSRENRAQAMRGAHEAAAYSRWLAREDLRAIVRYIGKDNPGRAKGFGKELRDKSSRSHSIPN
ncbi:hypothetical protein [Thiomonas sp.]